MKRMHLTWVLIGMLLFTGCGSTQTNPPASAEAAHRPTCTIAITCDSALNEERLTMELPEDGVMMERKVIPFEPVSKRSAALRAALLLIA